MSKTIFHSNIEHVPIDKVHPNKYNPNEMAPEKLQATITDIEKYGFSGGIDVRPHPDHQGHWIIIDGEHRWKALKALGSKTCPIINKDRDEAEAKILTVRRNNERGEFNTVKLARLIVDLQDNHKITDVAKRLDMPDHDVKFLIERSKIKEFPLHISQDYKTSKQEKNIDPEIGLATCPKCNHKFNPLL